MQTITRIIRGGDMDAFKVFIAGIVGFVTQYLSWVPDFLKFIILLSTCVYVVYKMMREVRRYYLGDESGKDDRK